jgi:hypothetical protein
MLRNAKKPTLNQHESTFTTEHTDHTKNWNARFVYFRVFRDFRGWKKSVYQNYGATRIVYCALIKLY